MFFSRIISVLTLATTAMAAPGVLDTNVQSCWVGQLHELCNGATSGCTTYGYLVSFSIFPDSIITSIPLLRSPALSLCGHTC